MKYLYTLIFLFSFGLANAQAPGYLGKKTFLQYDLYYMLAVGGPTAGNRMYAYDKIGISTRHNLKLNQVVSRSGVAGIGFDYFKTGINIDYLDNEDNILSEFSKMRVTAFSVHYNKYFMKKGSLAPIGIYHHFEGKYISAKALSPTFSNITHSTFYTGYGLGLKKIFKEKFFINFSGQVGWTWGDRSINTLGNDFETNIKTRINQRIYSHYIFENNIGVGILLF